MLPAWTNHFTASFLLSVSTVFPLFSNVSVMPMLGQTRVALHLYITYTSAAEERRRRRRTTEWVVHEGSLATEKQEQNESHDAAVTCIYTVFQKTKPPNFGSKFVKS